MGVIKWIMCYSTNISFSVLINGAASPLFGSKRGLSQGCPISPLLFLLVMEELSRLIKDMHHRGKLCGIRISKDCSIAHLIFMDDVPMFLNGGIGDLTTIQNTINLFKTATNMTINHCKSTITVLECSPHEIHFMIQRFPFNLT